MRCRLKLSEFDYQLPKELIAQYPAGQRDRSRMMVLDRDKKRFYHRSFSDIGAYFTKGDVVVLNRAPP